MDAKKDLPSINITLIDLKLKAQYYPGDKIDKDCLCDIKYMLYAMRGVESVMRKKCFWVGVNMLLYLVIDNARDHGSNKCVK